MFSSLPKIYYKKTKSTSGRLSCSSSLQNTCSFSKLEWSLVIHSECVLTWSTFGSSLFQRSLWRCEQKVIDIFFVSLVIFVSTFLKPALKHLSVLLLLPALITVTSSSLGFQPTFSAVLSLYKTILLLFYITVESLFI